MKFLNKEEKCKTKYSVNVFIGICSDVNWVNCVRRGGCIQCNKTPVRVREIKYKINKRKC